MRGNLGKGLHYEDQARTYLNAQGLCLVRQNFCCRLGEIDLIMRDAEYLCFVEVKYRKSLAFGGAASAIPPQKQRKLIRTAQFFLAAEPEFASAALRFDAFLIQRQANGENRFDWIKNAFLVDA